MDSPAAPAATAASGWPDMDVPDAPSQRQEEEYYRSQKAHMADVGSAGRNHSQTARTSGYSSKIIDVNDIYTMLKN